MRSYFLVVALFIISQFIISLSYGFSVNDYLLLDETPNQVSQETFTYEGVVHTLIEVNGQEAFLLADGQPLQNASEILPPLQYHYKSQFYPTEGNLTRVRALLQSYNDSRNNGETIYPGKEEFTCRQVLFLDGRVKIGNESVKCIDDTTCQRTSLLVYQAYVQGVGFGGPDQVFPLLKSFAYAAQGTDQIMGESFSRINTVNEDNVAENLQYIKDSIPALHSHRESIESTPFRTPLGMEDRASCSTSPCYQLCPAFKYDQAALGELDAHLSSLLQTVQPFAQRVQLSEKIQNDTYLRLHFRDLENRASYYSAVFSPLHAKTLQTIQNAEATLDIVTNLSLQAKVDQLKEISLIVNQSIDQRNFSALDSYLYDLQRLTSVVNEGIPGALAVFNATQEARREASLMLLLLETRELEAAQKVELGQLNDVQVQLDGIFVPGLSASDYGNITGAYTVISQRARNVMKSQDESPVFFLTSKFRGFTRRIGRGLSQGMSSFSLSPTTISSDNSFLFGFSIILFISLASLAAFLLISLLSGMKKITRVHSATGFLAVGTASLGILLFSGGFYYFLDKTTHHSDLSEFLVDFNTRNSSVVVVDTLAADSNASSSMVSCARSLTNSLRMLNKSAQWYELHDSSCYSDLEGMRVEQNASECLVSIGASNSLFVLNYSESYEVPRLSTIFQNRFDVHGDREYYDSCSLSLLFQR